jgi:2-polyprenyl-6-methoxyphenol hydroxylase-like FAD-dependent oxidoreductase
MSIGIVGSGVAGLHLGLLLRRHDLPVTMYTDRGAEQVADGRLPNTVAHHHHTLERERALGVHHWDAAEYGYVCHQHCLSGGPAPVRFRGDFEHPSSIIDYRLYLPALMRDFEDRGGELVVGAVAPGDLERLARDHELIVVASGRDGLASLFARRDDLCPYDRPQRRLSAGIYHGVAYSEPKGVGVHLALGQGELLELPIYSREGFATALLFEAIPGAELDALVELDPGNGAEAFDAAVLGAVERHFPALRERIDTSAFALQGPSDILRGALTPVVREDWVRLDGGCFAIAVGDAHCVVDPVNGQGANVASFSAWSLGEAILSDYAFDERFCRRVAREREMFVLGAFDWTNAILNPPPHVLELIGAMVQDKSVCDAYTQNFNHPDRQWDALASAERTASFIARHASGG